MPKRRRTKMEQEVDRELEAETKEELLAEFDQSQALHVPARKTENTLISIRLPKTMIKGLRDVAIQKGDIGYQQLIKIFIADGLSKSETITVSCIPKAFFLTSADTQGSSLIRPLQTLPSVSGDRPKAA